MNAGPMPRGGSFTGVWFSPQYGRLDMRQEGQSVIGEYAKDERTGRIQGIARGRVMRFQWTEKRELVSGMPRKTTGRGYFEYILDSDGDHKLRGEWGHDRAETGGGPWNAVKSKKSLPRLSFDSDSSEDAEEGDSELSEAEEGDDGTDNGEELDDLSDL